MEREDAQDATQGRSGESGVGGTTTGGDDDDGGLDRRTAGDGNPGLSQSLVVSPEEIQSRHYQEPTPIPTPNLVSTGSVATNCGQASVALDPDDAKNLIVTVGGDCNATNIAIGANGIIDDQGNVGYASLTYGKLIGDVDGSGMVDVLDGHAIRAEVPSFVDSSNFRDDLNHDGTVNARDHMIAKAHRGERLP